MPAVDFECWWSFVPDRLIRCRNKVGPSDKRSAMANKTSAAVCSRLDEAITEERPRRMLTSYRKSQVAQVQNCCTNKVNRDFRSTFAGGARNGFP
jgi:hypothetical protein